jgi:hypothetical protein
MAPAGTKVQLDLNPLTGWCKVSDQQLGGALDFTGEVVSNSLVGVVMGGWRELPTPSGDCSDPSDTIVALDPTTVTLARTN